MTFSPLTIAEIQAKLRSRETTASEITQQYLTRIHERDTAINAFLCVAGERALEQAEAIDQKVARGEVLPPLAGVPVAIKDALLTKGVATTAGSRMLEGYVPPYNATTVERLEQAGAILVGKTNCDEFAMGSSTENSAYFPTRNPHDRERVPGGSSGGSAAAMADSMAVATIGSDTGGSIRQPASLCGVVGLMGTYGRVSRYGLIAFASSLDHVGPFAHTVRDVASVFGVLAGHDPLDATTAHVPVPDYLAALDQPVQGMRLGVPQEYFDGALDPVVSAQVEKGIERFKALGCEIRPVSLPHTRYAIACYYIIVDAEVSSNLARYDGVRYGFRASDGGTLEGLYGKTRGMGFGAEAKRRILLGTYVLSAGYYDAYYIKAQKVRTLIAQDFRQAFEQVDALVTPTSPFTAFKLGEKMDDPLQMYLTDIYTATASLAGVPGISVPCGTDATNLPIGLQLIAKHFDEARLLQLAHAFEKADGFTL